jgi:hypothetical protein
MELENDCNMSIKEMHNQFQQKAPPNTLILLGIFKRHESLNILRQLPWITI